MDKDELLRQCSPEFQEQVKRESEVSAKEHLLQLERARDDQYWTELRAKGKAVLAWLLGVFVVLSMIYWAVKFIKWAWYH